jgi:iron complex outermembrane recepter protein
MRFKQHRRLSIAALGALTAMSSTSTLHAQETLQLEEIIVTAEKRETDLQKTPIAITALSAEALTNAGVSQAEDLNALVPGLAIGQGGPNTTVYLRGVGNYSTNAFADPAVAFNLDGIYMARVTGLSGNFFDVARVEVLKGPQGTLYGRNATGGAINVVSNKPSTKGFEGGVGLELGNYSLVKANGFVNVPLSNTVAIRVAGQKTDRDGYQTDGNDDDVSRAARVGLRYEPGDSTSLQITGNYLHLGGMGSAHVPVTTSGYYDNSNPWVGQSIALTNTLAAVPGGGRFAGVDRTKNHNDVTVKGLTAEYATGLGPVDLTVLANHTSTDNLSKFFGPGFMVNNNTQSKQNSLETRLSASNDSLNWQFGLFYFQEKSSENYLVDQGYAFNQTGVDVKELKDTTYAAFGQGTLNLSDRTRLTVGARYTNEKKEQNGLIFSKGACATGDGRTTVTVADLVAAVPQAAAGGYTDSYCQDTMTTPKSWNDFSWKAGLDFDVSNTSMMYTSISRGFKAGGFFAAGDHAVVQQSDGSFRTGNSYDPETLTAFAVGSKNRFLASRLQLNAEAFYWDYKDHQESYLGPTTATGLGFNFVTQKADAHIYGLEIESQFLITDKDKLDTKVQYLHAEYTDAKFINASPGPGNPSPVIACPTIQKNPTTAPAIWTADCDGMQMSRSPTLTANVDYSHTFALSNGGSLVPSANVEYSSSYWPGVDYNPLNKQKSYTVYGADLGYHAQNDAWSLTAWGANLGNKDIRTNSFTYPSTNSLPGGGVGVVQLKAPRTYGVRFNAKF